MVDIVKPSQRVAMVDGTGLVTLTWDSFFRQVGVDKPAELAADIAETNQSILDNAVLMAFHD